MPWKFFRVTLKVQHVIDVLRVLLAPVDEVIHGPVID